MTEHRAIAQLASAHTRGAMFNVHITAGPPVLTPRAAAGLLRILQTAAERAAGPPSRGSQLGRRSAMKIRPAAA